MKNKIINKKEVESLSDIKILRKNYKMKNQTCRLKK